MNPNDLYRPIGPTPPAGMRRVVGPKELYPSRTMPGMAEVARALMDAFQKRIGEVGVNPVTLLKEMEGKP